MEIRLNRYLAQAGVASRRKADELIDQGLVQVNGRTVFELGIKINPKRDTVTINGKKINFIEDKIYLAFYKPRQVLTTMFDPEGRPSIADYLKHIKKRVFPIGRLDWASEGLLLISNDGDWAQKILHPKEQVTKTYLVKLDGEPKPEHFEKLKRGISIIGGKVKALAVSLDRRGTSKTNRWVRIIVTEGKKHQIRQMFEKIGFDVIRLKRVAIGQLKIGSLRPGEMRYLTAKQIQLVFKNDVISERYSRSLLRNQKNRL